MATSAPSPTPTLLVAVANATAAVLLNASAAATQAPQPSVAAAMADPAAAAGLQTLPPMPEPPIFDAPFNPYYGALAQAMQGMNDTQKTQFQPFIVAQILEASRNKSMDQSRIVIGGYALVLLFCLVLLAYIRHNRQLALKGDSEATRKIILPAFEPMLWFLAALTTVYVAFFTATISADFITVKSSLVTVEFIYATKQFLYLFVPVYMLQKSLSVPALARAALVTFAVSVYSIPFTWLMYTYGKDHQRVCYFANQIIHWLTFIPMFYYCVHPPSRASKRAIREYAVYYFITQMLYLASMEAFRQGSVNDSMTLSWVTVGWNATCPFFMWRLLKADTEHWRGMGKRAVELQTRFRRKGKVAERISAKGLHVLIELHRKYIIDFASLDIQHKISEAESAMVFRGKLSTKSLPVAIKVYTPETFDEDTVAEYSHEAALCGALHHPNIVTFYGMCVCPPTICLVTELCQGSLQDITRSMARKTVQATHRQQFLINIGYMIDAARAIAYLHSFSPAFVHRDIKPGSFLVDAEGSVKLTDFGASRTLSARSASGHQHEHEAPAAAMATMQENGKKKVLTNAGGLGAGLAEIMGNLRGNPEYMAPEVIRSKNAGTSKYGEAADIYALAMTMWDILYPNESKYNSTVRTVSSAQSGDVTQQQLNRRESEVFECVFAGQRPFLDERMYPPLRELIQTAWHPDPRLRPSAQNIVHVLETIQEETCAVYALELIESLECGAAHAALKAPKPGVAHPPKGITDISQISFAGSRAIEKMYALEHIAAESEAVRLGNMLLDAGFLHHIKHARSFEYSAALYFFDEEQIQLCQPLAMLEEGAVSTEQDQAGDGGRPRYAQQGQGSARLARGRHARHSDTSSSHRPHHGHAHAGRRGRQDSSQQGSNVLMDNMTGLMCTCRKLGQKLESAQTTRRRLRLKFKSSDENLVTARLLADEPMAEFGDFPDNAYNSMGRLA